MDEKETTRKELEKGWRNMDMIDFNRSLRWARNYTLCVCSECERKHQGWLEIGKELCKNCMGFYEKTIREVEHTREIIRKNKERKKSIYY